MMLYPFALALMASMAAWIASRVMAGRWPPTPPALPIIVLTLLACYVVGFLLVFVDPYFDENGVPEFIDWNYRWAWAGEYGGWLAPLALPVVFLLRSWSSRR